MNDDLSQALALWLVAACLATGSSGLLSWLRPERRALRLLADGLGLLCLAGAAAGWIARYRFAGHLPLFGTYESAWSLALATLAAAAVARWRRPGLRGVWPLAGLVVAGLLLHGWGYGRDAFPLTISERSWVVDLHAIAAWTAFGCLAANAGVAAFRLVTARGEASEERDPALAFSLSLGFALHSAMMASGSLYKFMLFGSAWTFDPVETLGFVAWMSYGALLHMHLFAGWDGRRLARWSLGLFVLLVVSYRGIVYFPAWATYHIFDMDLRMHVVE